MKRRFSLPMPGSFFSTYPTRSYFRLDMFRPASIVADPAFWNPPTHFKIHPKEGSAFKTLDGFNISATTLSGRPHLIYSLQVHFSMNRECNIERPGDLTELLL